VTFNCTDLVTEAGATAFSGRFSTMGREWCEDWAEDDLEEAGAILHQVHRELVISGTSPVTIPRFPDSPDDLRWGADLYEHRAEGRRRIVDALVREGILRSVQEQTRKGDYGKVEKVGLLVDADRERIRAELHRINDWMTPEPWSEPKPPGPIRQHFNAAFGRGLAWFVMSVLILLLIVLLTAIVPGFRGFVIDLIEAVSRGQK